MLRLGDSLAVFKREGPSVCTTPFRDARAWSHISDGTSLQGLNLTCQMQVKPHRPLTGIVPLDSAESLEPVFEPLPATALA